MVQRSLTLDEFIPYRLSFTTNLVSDVIAGAYRALFGLSVPEWRLVAVVAGEGGSTQQAIGARTRMDKVTVSRAAISLVARGLLERFPNPDDRRSHLLQLSASGRALYARIVPKALELERRVLADLDDEELARFVATLRRIDRVALAMLADGEQPKDLPRAENTVEAPRVARSGG
jgi:DNA-binding MarR family transcriptional regulator